MRIQSAVGMLFREHLYKQDFIEIHSPKLIGGTSEGGANVFRLKYFNDEACLA
jgi:aspartyl-tRNA synthetase